VLVPDGSGLLVIGRQVLTDFSKEIDLLCMDSNGDLVIVELKRNKTPREVTAQALDYASWVETLDSARIQEIAAGYLPGNKSLRDAFEEAFVDAEFPDVINGGHSIMVVASSVDDSTERIIRYLSSKGIKINFVRFQMFKSDGEEYLARTFTVSVDEAEQNARRGPTKHTRQLKTLEFRLEKCVNDAEKAFIRERLDDPAQVFDNNKVAILYQFGGKSRFRVRARTDHMHVTQKGRFPDDITFWKSQLVSPEIGPRDNGNSLGFGLSAVSDFQNFQKFMKGDAAKINWLPKANSDTENEDDENGEEQN
jgi:hypothetical protein